MKTSRNQHGIHVQPDNSTASVWLAEDGDKPRVLAKAKGSVNDTLRAIELANCLKPGALPLGPITVF